MQQHNYNAIKDYISQQKKANNEDTPTFKELNSNEDNDQPTYMQDTQTQKRKSMVKKIVITLVIVLVIILIYCIWKRRKTQQSQQQNIETMVDQQVKIKEQAQQARAIIKTKQEQLSKNIKEDIKPDIKQDIKQETKEEIKESQSPKEENAEIEEAKEKEDKAEIEVIYEDDEEDKLSEIGENAFLQYVEEQIKEDKEQKKSE